ncbi:capsid [uncultured virus]|uniref:Capsid n=1 Tax=uncultured virus TaxID=340016 RepID=A0A2K9LWZ6_9VIRU|nr:capsid [uncultured virus]
MSGTGTGTGIVYYGKRKRSTSGGARKRGRYAPGATNVPLPPGLAGRYRRVGFYGRYGGRESGLKPEMKFFDTAVSFTFDATGEIPATGQLTLIPQGDTESTRDGRMAVIKSIQVRGVMELAPAAGAFAAGVAYMYLVLDTQCNGAAAAITDVFTSNVMSTNMLNLANSGRFRILKRWVVPLKATAGVTTAYNLDHKAIEFYKRCNIPVVWSSTAGAITEIRSNNIFLCAGSKTLDDIIDFIGTVRLRFLG